MISASSAFAEQINSDVRSFSARFLYNGEEIGGDIKELTVNKGTGCDSAFTVGSLYSSYIAATIDGCTIALQDKELELQFGVWLSDETIEYVTVGLYTVSEVATSAYSTTLTGIGRLSAKCGGAYKPNGVFPKAVSTVLGEVADITGCNIDVSAFPAENLAETVQKSMDGLLCREALMYVAGLLGGFVTESNTGGIVIRPFSNTANATVDADRTTELYTFNDYDYMVSGLTVIVTEDSEDDNGNTVGGVSYSHGTPSLVLSNPYMTQSLFNLMAPRVTGYTYRPGSIPITMGDIRLEAGDVLTVADLAGVRYMVPCLGIVHTYDGGLKTTVTAPGVSESQGAASFSGSLQKAVEKTQAELVLAESLIAQKASVTALNAMQATVQDLTANKADVADLDATNASVQKLEANKVNVADLQATNAAVENLEANKADIDLANIADGCITNAMIGTGAVDTAQIADGSITDAKIVELTANKIASGTIDASKINVTNLKCENLTVGKINGQQIANGAIATAQLATGAVETDNVADEAITNTLLAADAVTADKIVSAAVTADKLAANSVTTNKIVSNAVTADKLSANAVTANKIAAGAITTEKLGANAVTAEKIAAGAITADMISAGTLTGVNLTGENLKIGSWNIQSGGFSSDAMLTSSTRYDGIYEYRELKLEASGNRFYDVDTASITVNAAGGIVLRTQGGLYLIMESPKLHFASSNPIEVNAPCEQNTYTTFDSDVVSDGTVVVVKKLGWCLVHGSVKLTGNVATMTNVLDSTKVPAPQHGVGIYTTAEYWSSQYIRPMRVGIGAGGSLRIQFGGEGSFTFSITYPIA